MEQIKNRRRKIAIVSASIAAIAVIIILILLLIKKNATSAPTIWINTPGKVSISGDREFTIDVSISELTEDVLFPASSVSVSFDKSRLEFLGMEEGNIFILSDNGFDLPSWSVNVENSNKTGLINVMYLDETAGRYAFSSKGFDEVDRNILIRFKFRLRGSVIRGDIMDFVIQDAVMAAVDSTQSLATQNNTLKAVEGRIAADD
ncbi:MAG: hypothetical protein J1E60_07805 [Christensenellaceae bacterium]|nr:hypothetical protein [Christensenellaceae bacterium]